MTLGDVRREMPHVDDLDVVERAKINGALEAALHLARPRNWWGTGASQTLLLASRADGLPLAWVPRPEIVKAVDTAGDRPSRIAVLMDRRADVLDDCRSALDDCDEVDIQESFYLGQCALDALVAGHGEAAMALAVSIGEPLAKWAARPRVRAYDGPEDMAQWEKLLNSRSEYKHAQAEIDRLGSGPVEFWDFNHQVLIAPIPSFFAEWRPGWSTPPPAKLSRHLVAHRAPRDHFTGENALLAVMLVVSILRDKQEWTREVRIDDARTEFEHHDL